MMSLAIKRVVVTGGSGFVGSVVVDKFTDAANGADPCVEPTVEGTGNPTRELLYAEDATTRRVVRRAVEAHA